MLKTLVIRSGFLIHYVGFVELRSMMQNQVSYFIVEMCEDGNMTAAWTDDTCLA